MFHVDFDNLDDTELGLLLYALRPKDTFRHKLGLGKRLGLGSVRIDPLAVFYVDRQQRYGDPSESRARYTRLSMAKSLNQAEEWSARYRREQAALKNLYKTSNGAPLE